jgi:hypothetical protein
VLRAYVQAQGTQKVGMAIKQSMENPAPPDALAGLWDEKAVFLYTSRLTCIEIAIFYT